MRSIVQSAVHASFATAGLLVLALASACSGAASGGDEADGGAIPASDGSVYDASMPDTGIGFDVVVAPPVFTDWVCPGGWVAAPGFTDENGVENPPEGVKQFNICRPPENWAPVQMKDWACPEGWLPKPALVDEAGVENLTAGMAQYSICEPPDVPKCSAGEVAYIGETACHAIGTSCPAGDFLDESVFRGIAAGFAGKARYVKAGAAGGDGSITSPFGAIADAMTAAAAGDIVVLSKGTFNEAVSLGKAIALVGACTGGTTILASTPDTTLGVVSFIFSGTSMLANVRLSGSRVGVLAKSMNSKTAIVDSVEVAGATSAGVMAMGHSVTVQIRNVVLRDTVAGGATDGFGLDVGTGATVTADGIVISGNMLAGAAATGNGSAISLDRAVIRDTLPTVSGAFGRGVILQQQVSLSLKRSLITGSREAGIFGAPGQTPGAAPAITLEDCVVQDTEGRGLSISDGTTLAARRVIIQRNREFGIYVITEPGRAQATVTMEDAVIRDTGSVVGGQLDGQGFAANASRVAMDRVLVDRNRHSGIQIATDEPDQSTAVLALHDAIVRDTQLQEYDQLGGQGLVLHNNAQVTAERLLLSGNHTSGILVSGDEGFKPTSLTIADAVVADTGSQKIDPPAGIGLMLLDNVSVKGSRIALVRNRTSGIMTGTMFPGAQLSLDLDFAAVSDTKSAEGTLEWGRGLDVEGPASVKVRHAIIENVRDIGVSALSQSGDTGTSDVELSDVIVRGVHERESDGLNGMGIVTSQLGTMNGTRVLIDRCMATGLLSIAQPGLAPPAVDFIHLVVRDIESEASTAKYGRGATVQDCSPARFSNVLLEGNRELSFTASCHAPPAGYAVELSDITIRGTIQSECAEIPDGQPGSCVASGASFGAGTALQSLGAPISIARFEISGSYQCGIQIAAGGMVHASDGDIHHNGIGVNVQVEGYDTATVLSPTVTVHDNDTNVDARELPLPDPMTVADSIKQ